jgi:predicted SAM-dependent methyltransferase
MIGLNVGSGQRPFTSTPEVKWINIDSQERWNPDVQCNAEKLPYDGESVDYVVLHHLLEHAGCGEAAGLIKECYRVLKPGGSLLVFVPNIRALSERWLQGGLSTQIYMTNVYGAYMGSEDDRHKWGYDPFTLLDFLNTAADNKWCAVARFDWRTIPGSDLAKDFWVADMECVK